MWRRSGVNLSQDESPEEKCMKLQHLAEKLTPKQMQQPKDLLLEKNAEWNLTDPFQIIWLPEVPTSCEAGAGSKSSGLDMGI